MRLQVIENVDGHGKVHIWSHESPDAYGGHYRSLCGHQFGIEWRLANFHYAYEKMCVKCCRIAERERVI